METHSPLYIYRRVVQAKLFIDHHYADNICLNDISDEAYFSKYHFIRLFKKIYGKTPHQYAIAVRIEKAGLLLAEGNPVADACFGVGFESLSSFAGLFRKKFGMTPSAYRNNQQQRKTAISKSPLHFIPNCFAEQNGWTKNRNFQEVLS